MSSRADDVRAGGAFIEAYVKRDRLDQGIADFGRDLDGLKKIGEAASGSFLEAFNNSASTAGLSRITSEINLARSAILELKKAAAVPATSSIDAVRSIASPVKIASPSIGPKQPTDAEIRKVRFISGMTRPFMASKKQNEAFDKMVRSHSVGGDTYNRNLSRSNPSEFIKQEIGRQQASQSPAMTSPATTSPAATSPAAAIKPTLKQMPAVAVAATAIRAPVVAAATAVQTMAAPMTGAIAATSRLQQATGAASMSMMGFGMRLGIAGAGIAALAVPMKLLTGTFASSAVAVRDYAKEHGVTLTEAIKKTNSALTVDQVQLGVAFAGTWGKLKDSAKKAWESVAASIGSALAPQLMEQTFSIQGIIKAIKETGTSIGNWITKNKALAGWLFSASSGAALLGAGIVALGTIITVVGANIGVLAGVVAGLMSPFVLIPAALAAGGYAWVTYTETGKRALKTFLDTIAPFIKIVKDTIGGISDAIVAGDMSLAWQIAMAGMKLTVAKGFEALRPLVGETLISISDDILAGDFSSAWETTVLGMGAVWDNFAKHVVSVFTGAINSVLDVWDDASDWLAKPLLELMMAGDTEEMKGQKRKALEEDRGRRIENKQNPESFRSFLTRMNEEAERTATESEKTVANKTSKSSAKSKDRLKELQDNLDSLRGLAADKAGQVRNKGLDPPDISGKSRRSESMVTFSAAGAIAAGYAGKGGGIEGIAKEQLKVQKEQKKLQEQLIESDAKVIAAVEKFSKGFERR